MVGEAVFLLRGQKRDDTKYAGDSNSGEAGWLGETMYPRHGGGGEGRTIPL